MSESTNSVYVNGEFVRAEDATVSVLDRGFQYGDGCFEGIAAVGGRILHLNEHVDRMFNSARMLRIDMPVNRDEFRNLILETAARSGMKDTPSGYMRPILTRGSGPMGIGNSSELEGPTLVIIPRVGDTRLSMDGEIRSLTSVISRYVLPSASTLDPAIKSLNYLPNMLSYLEAKDRGADTAIFRTESGLLTEGYGMNFFVVMGRSVLTPPRHLVLRGITRRFVLQVARELGFECAETDLTEYDLQTADEAFATSSLLGVARLSSVEGGLIGTPESIPVTLAIRKSYLDLALATGTVIA